MIRLILSRRLVPARLVPASCSFSDTDHVTKQFRQLRPAPYSPISCIHHARRQYAVAGFAAVSRLDSPLVAHLHPQANYNYDLASILQHMPIPTSKDLPHKYKSLFKDGIFDKPHILPTFPHLSSKVRTVFTRRPDRKLWQCSLSFSGLVVVEGIQGVGESQSESMYAAYTHLLSRLYVGGLLEGVFNSTEGLQTSPQIAQASIEKAPVSTKTPQVSLGTAKVSTDVPDVSRISNHKAYRPPVCIMDQSQIALMTSTGGAAVDLANAASTHDNIVSRRALDADQRFSVVLSPYQRNMLSTMLINASKTQIRRAKSTLPVSKYSQVVIETIQINRCCVVIGETGSGKTTQIPQILLDSAINSMDGASCNIICTQPRRMAAISVAHRVASERGQSVGQQVGYQVRFDSRTPRHGGSINYCTTGILLQKLQHTLDHTLENISHLIIDEVHERDLDIDLLLAILKKALESRTQEGKKVPKVVLMSATAEAEKLANYFDSVDWKCPTLVIPGQTFPVKEHYLEEIMTVLPNPIPAERGYVKQEEAFARLMLDKATATSQGIPSILRKDVERDSLHGRDDKEIILPIGLITDTIVHLMKTTDEGDILVFLPGISDLRNINNQLQTRLPGDTNSRIYTLHSQLRIDQDAVFESVPFGCRKIILATNIAETSITIPGIRYVVDSGKQRRRTYDYAHDIKELETTWISKSSQKQRAGRAGRVREGDYYALFSRARWQSFDESNVPDMCVNDLQGTCLAIKAHAPSTSIREFFSETIDPPDGAAVDAAIDSLKNLGALTEEEQFSPLGHVLSKLPLVPAMGKMVVLGMIYRCLDSMIILSAASESSRDLFAVPLESNRVRLNSRVSLTAGNNGDQFALLSAFKRLRDMDDRGDIRDMKRFCDEFFIDFQAYQELKLAVNHIKRILRDAGFLPDAFDLPQEAQGTQPIKLRWVKPEHNLQPTLDTNSENFNLIRALLVSGYSLNIARRVSHSIYQTRNQRRAIIHPSSVLHPPKISAAAKRELPPDDENQIINYARLTGQDQESIHFMRQNTTISPLLALLFAWNVQPSNSENAMLVNEWLRIDLRHEGDQPWAKDLREVVMGFRRALRVMEENAYEAIRRGGLDALEQNRNWKIFISTLESILSGSMKPTKYHWGQLAESCRREVRPTRSLSLSSSSRATKLAELEAELKRMSREAEDDAI